MPSWTLVVVCALLAETALTACRDLGAMESEYFITVDTTEGRDVAVTGPETRLRSGREKALADLGGQATWLQQC